MEPNKDVNTPKLAEKQYQKERARGETADWVTEAFTGDRAILKEDDRADMMERERQERAEKLARELKDRNAVVDFLGAQRNAKADVLVIGTSRNDRTRSVLGEAVDSEEPLAKKSKTKPKMIVSVVAKKASQSQPKKATPTATATSTPASAPKASLGALSLLGSYQ